MVKHIYKSYQATGGAIIVVIIAAFAFFTVMRTPSSTNISLPQNEIQENELDITGEIGQTTVPTQIEENNGLLAETAFDMPVQTFLLPCNPQASAIDNEEEKMLSLINQHRSKVGAPALKLSGVLNDTADILAWDHNKNGYGAHTDSTGGGMQDRLRACGYTGGLASENTGHYGTTQAMFNAWINSEGHRNNIESDSFLYIGIARAPGPAGSNFWTTNFSSVDPGGTVSYDDSPSITSSPTPPISTPTTIITSPTPTTISTPGNIRFSVQLIGFGNNSDAGENNTPNLIKMGAAEFINSENGESTKYENLTFTYDPISASFLGGVLHTTTATYNVKLKLDNTLTKDLGSIQVAGSSNVDIANIILTSGDINQDNVIDLLDYNIILDCYGSVQCAQKTQSDFNLDGKVDEIDLNIFYVSLANRYGD